LPPPGTARIVPCNWNATAGLGVNAGHDLNRENLTGFLQVVPGVSEVSIGHALIADALELGYAATVEAYNQCIALASA
jgi:pyridoxine 5-phosphate synthase